MSNFDSILSKLVFLLVVIFCSAYGLEYYCGWRAVKTLTIDSSRLKGERIESLFERTPILPDRFVFCSRWPKTITIEYDAGRWGMLRFPKVDIIVVGDVIEDCWRLQGLKKVRNFTHALDNGSLP